MDQNFLSLFEEESLQPSANNKKSSNKKKSNKKSETPQNSLFSFDAPTLDTSDNNEEPDEKSVAKLDEIEKTESTVLTNDVEETNEIATETVYTTSDSIEVKDVDEKDLDIPIDNIDIDHFSQINEDIEYIDTMPEEAFVPQTTDTVVESFPETESVALIEAENTADSSDEKTLEQQYLTEIFATDYSQIANTLLQDKIENIDTSTEEIIIEEKTETLTAELTLEAEKIATQDNNTNESSDFAIINEPTEDETVTEKLEFDPNTIFDVELSDEIQADIHNITTIVDQGLAEVNKFIEVLPEGTANIETPTIDSDEWEDDDEEIFINETPQPRQETLFVGVQPEKYEELEFDIADQDDGTAVESLPEWELTKNYYTIGEVATMFNVNNSHIRFWTKEFNLRLRTNRKGDRMYTPTDIDKLRMIHELVKVKRHTLKGAKDILNNKKINVAKNITLKDNLVALRDLLVNIRTQL